MVPCRGEDWGSFSDVSGRSRVETDGRDFPRFGGLELNFSDEDDVEKVEEDGCSRIRLP